MSKKIWRLGRRELLTGAAASAACAALPRPSQAMLSSVPIAPALLGGAKAPLPVRAANLKAAYAAYGGLISHTAAMSSPPTVTDGGASQFSAGIPGLTTEYDYTTTAGTKVSYLGGGDLNNGSGYRGFPVATEAASGGNLGSGKDAVIWRIETTTDSPTFGYYILTGTNYRLLVNDQFVSLSGSSFGTGGGTAVSLAFGSRATRNITLEGVQADRFFGIAVASGDTITKRTRSITARMIVVGDSFTTGTGATMLNDSWSQILGDNLGVVDLWSSGVGSTGYVANNSGTLFNLTQRLSDVNSTGPWDGIVVAMGLNDIGLSAATITANAATCLSSYRTNNPGTPIFVIGPWDANAPSAPVTNYAATKAAIQAGMAGISGCYFIDMQGVSYTQNGATLPHPDTAGHLTLGNYVTGKIKQVLGLT